MRHRPVRERQLHVRHGWRHVLRRLDAVRCTALLFSFREQVSPLRWERSALLSRARRIEPVPRRHSGLSKRNVRDVRRARGTVLRSDLQRRPGNGMSASERDLLQSGSQWNRLHAVHEWRIQLPLQDLLFPLCRADAATECAEHRLRSVREQRVPERRGVFRTIGDDSKI